MKVHLTPASIAFLAQFLFSAILCFYLWRIFTRQKQPQHRRSSLFFFLGISTFSLLLFVFFLDASLLGGQRLMALFVENPILAIGMVVSFLFVFSYPDEDTRHKRIKHLVLFAAVMYALYEIVFAIYRTSIFRSHGVVNWRPEMADIYLVALMLCLATTFLFRGFSLVQNGSARFRWSQLATNPYSRATRAFFLIFLIPIFITWVNYEYSTEGSPLNAVTYYLVLSTGIITTIQLVTIAYINTLPTGFRFRERVSTISLAVVLASLSVLGWALSPAISAHYEPDLPSNETYVFSPLESNSAYAVEKTVSEFDEELGTNLRFFDLGVKDNYVNIDLDFTFIYFDKAYDQIIISDNGAIGFEYEPSVRQLVHDYRKTVAIVPVYVDLFASQPEGSIFLKEVADRITVTWKHVPSKANRSIFYNFQVILFANGTFQINYGDMPKNYTYMPDNDAEASPMLLGLICGEPADCGYQIPLAPQAASYWTNRINSNGLVVDFYAGYRSSLHASMVPIAMVVLGTSAAIVVLLYVFLVQAVDKPINSLMDGISRIEEGRLEFSLPIYHGDEIGQATTTFNRMAEQLRNTIITQEASLMEEKAKGNRPPNLTPIQWDVMQLVAMGILYKEIAAQLHISERTVKYHMGRVIENLGVDNRAQAIAAVQTYLEN